MSTRVVQETAQDVVKTAASRIVELARESIVARGRFTLALAGGSTPKTLYELLATTEWSQQLDWSRTHIFFGDERAVQPDDDLSNWKMAQEALLSKVPLPAENVYRMEAERDDLESAARDYEQALSPLAPLDLVLLGMGDDGHTASLFPHSPALNERSQLCVATPVASLQPHVRRLTLTLEAVNQARNVWVLVTGKSKAQRLQQVFEGKRDISSTPVQGVEPTTGELIWLLDKEAAALL